MSADQQTDAMVFLARCVVLVTITTAVSAVTNIGHLASSTGTEFVLGLMQQTVPGGAVLQITSNVSTHARVQAPYIGLAKDYAITPGITSVPLAQDLRSQGSELIFKGIHVKADNPVNIQVLDGDVPYFGGYLALPVACLAKEYIVASFGTNGNSDSQLLVTVVTDRTKVTVTLKTSGVVTYKGRQFRNGELIAEIMDQFETLQIQSTADLTGSLVKADHAVSVFSGSACANVPIGSSTCDYMVEQMPPTASWGKDFVVPSLNPRSKFMLRVIASAPSTTASITYNGNTRFYSVNVSGHFDTEITSLSPVLVSSNNPVLVVQYSESKSTDNSNSGPSMTIIPALKQFSSDYVIAKPSGSVKTTVDVILTSASLSGLRVNNKLPTPTAQYSVHVKDLFQTYTVYQIDLGDPVNYISHVISTERFGLVVHGSAQGYTYSQPGGLMLNTQQDKTIIQLRGGSSPREGRVEVYYHGQWGTVCSNYFDTNDAIVICKMLGYNYSPAGVKIHGSSHYGPGTGTVVIDSLHCIGTETDVTSCPSSPWGTSSCSHSNDVGLDCGTQIRLTGTNDSREGRLEVMYNDRWGGVCDDNFGPEEASVVCRMLGHGIKGYTYTGSRPDHAPMWLDDLHCSGEEEDLAQCMTKDWAISDCSDRESVWVACYSPTPLRLVGGPSPAAGRLEVAVKKEWGTVCDVNFDARDADVVCRTLGFKHASTQSVVYKGAHYGSGTGEIAVTDLSCSGYETDVSECPSRPWLVTDPACSHKNDVGVDCGSAIRLVDGSTPLEGRVEVYYKGGWGTVCDDGFTVQDAKVVCNLLGYPHGPAVVPFLPSAGYGAGTGNIVIDDLRCLGSETNIAHCPSNPWGQHNCGHSEDVGVNCSTSVRLVNGSSPSEGRLEVYYDGMWGTVCDDRFDLSDAEVVCRMLGYRYHVARKIRSGAYYGRGQGRVIIGELHCSGSEVNIGLCPSDTWLTSTCSHNEDVGIDCGVRLQDAISMSCTSTHWNIQVDMRKLLRALPGAKASDIYLGDNTCTGSLYENMLTFNQGLHQCLTSEQILGNENIFRNGLVYAYHDPLNPSVIRYHNWTIDLTCTVRTNGYATASIGSQIIPTGPTVTSSAHFNVAQAFYSDLNFQNVINLSSVPVGSTVYVKIFSTDADFSQKMILKDCYTTPSSSPYDPNKFYVIQNSCEADSSVHIMNVYDHDTRFQFQVFDVVSSGHHGISLHCDVRFCHVSDFTPSCTSQCRQHSVRMVSVTDEDGLIRVSQRLTFA